ncbi:ABC transporter substrate-binding protein [Nocardioides sp.]|uniref:ABC transporter substrate-binding protein n=1 Tax=Nocardioides sp. TaxID=35761 RepID=UPI0039E2D45D
MRIGYRRLLAICSAGVVLAGVAGCGGEAKSSGSSSSGAIVLGASLPLSGSLGQTGIDLQAGYQQAVDEVNADGGLTVDGEKREVTLEILDNRTDATTATQQVRQLIDESGATAILGSCTPTLVVPQALVAEQLQVPYVTSCNPVQSFTSGNEEGWKYSWDLFFDETAQATAVADGLAQADTNKKVALFTDTEPDGVAERTLYQAAFAEAGLTVVGDYTFPVGTTDFSSFINDAKSAGAEIVVGQMIPPDGITLWKQMKALKFSPKVAFVSKAAANAEWTSALAEIAEGTLTDGLWDLTANPTASQEILDGPLGEKFSSSFADLTIALLGYTVVQITADAIESAGSTEAAALNTAIGETNGDYALGTVTFDDQHTYATKYVLEQWQSDVMRQVIPSVDGATLQVPAAGLQ